MGMEYMISKSGIAQKYGRSRKVSACMNGMSKRTIRKNSGRQATVEQMINGVGIVPFRHECHPRRSKTRHASSKKKLLEPARAHGCAGALRRGRAATRARGCHERNQMGTSPKTRVYVGLPGARRDETVRAQLRGTLRRRRPCRPERCTTARFIIASS